METYTGFAEVYDLFMEETPYEKWGEFLAGRLSSEGIDGGLLLDLGCGTGTMTRILAGRGYDMIGVDGSAEMLAKAREYEGEHKFDILYLCQDMREFELYGTVRAVVSCCDCVNYILDEDELVQVFSLVNNYLDPKGLFVFDFNTLLKYARIGDKVFAENQERASFIWENYFDEDEGLNEYDLTLFVKREGGLYERCEETHVQRGYTLSDMKRVIERAGMEFVEAFEDYGGKMADEGSERICIVARECGK